MVCVNVYNPHQHLERLLFLMLGKATMIDLRGMFGNTLLHLACMRNS